MSPLVEEQMQAEGELCHAIYRLIIGHRFSAYEVRDIVDKLSGQFYRNPRRWRATNPSPRRLADYAFRGIPVDRERGREAPGDDVPIDRALPVPFADPRTTKREAPK